MNKILQISLTAILLASPIAFAENPFTLTKESQKISGLWIDVRTPAEHRNGYLSGSINIPVNEIAENIAKVVPNKTTPINLYCRSGRRAEQARNILQQLGYRNVINHGGYEHLRQQGYR